MEQPLKYAGTVITNQSAIPIDPIWELYNAEFFTPVIKHIKCHAGLDPASNPILDSRFRRNDGFDIYCFLGKGVVNMQNNIRISDDFKEIGIKTMDDRNRLTLGEIFKGYKRIRLYKNDRGEVLLQPIVEIPASELWLFQNSNALESVQKGLKDASEGKITKINLDEL